MVWLAGEPRPSFTRSVIARARPECILCGRAQVYRPGFVRARLGFVASRAIRACAIRAGML